MSNILKTMKITGLVGFICLFLSILIQGYVYQANKQITGQTNEAVSAANKITSYIYQYQLTVYKNTYNPQEHIDYSEGYEKCLDGISRMTEVLNSNSAMSQIDPDQQLLNKLNTDIQLLTSKRAANGTLESDDKLISSLISQTAVITSQLEQNWKNRQKFLEVMESISIAFSCLLLLICSVVFLAGQKHAKNEEEEYEKQVKKENYTDGLTGLMNQKYVTHVLPGLVEKTASGYVYMFDMDNFKKLNDTRGHEAGDRALQGFADVMMKSVREKDIPCRLGGDEFLLYSRGIDNDKTAMMLAKRIQDSTRERFKGTDLSIVSISCGVAPVYEGETFDVAKNKADKALYYVKENGKGGRHLQRK